MDRLMRDQDASVAADGAPHSAETLRARAHRFIPGGAHTYSKGDDQFPANAPALIARGQGCRVWDTDGQAYLDWGMGLRSVILGHAYPRVLEAVRAQLALGTNFVRPSPIEGELAEVLVGLVPEAEMVKFAKNGSDVTSAAVRLSRAYTGRDLVAICRDNPFYSFDDWFIGTTPCNAGIPEAVKRLTLSFPYGDVASLERLFAEHPGQIACVMIEPAATAPPVEERGCSRCAFRRTGGPGFSPVTECPNRTFLQGALDIAHRHGAVVVFDEMITGFRWDLPGAQTLYGVIPDMSTFGKALGNGFAISALVGRREILEQGGIHHTDRPKVFLLSTTHGGETHAMAAAIATIREIQEQPVISHIWRHGEALQNGLNALSRELGLTRHIWCEGYPCSPVLQFRGSDGRPSAELQTLFIQEMIQRGILLSYIAISYSHTMAEVDETLDAARKTMAICRQGLESGTGRLLDGPPVKPVFRRFN